MRSLLLKVVFLSALLTSVSSLASTRTCGHEDGVLLKLHFDSRPPWAGTGELSGKVVSSWVQDEISIPLSFRKAGGSSTPAWWQSVATFPGGRSFRTTYWFKGETIKVFLFLEDSGVVAQKLELTCN